MSYFTFSILPFLTLAGGLHGAWGASVGNGGLAPNHAGHVAEYSCFSAGDTAWRRSGYRTDEEQFQGSVRRWEQASDCISALPHPCSEIAREMPFGGAGGEEHGCVTVAFCQSGFSWCCA